MTTTRSTTTITDTPAGLSPEAIAIIVVAAVVLLIVLLLLARGRRVSQVEMRVEEPAAAPPIIDAAPVAALVTPPPPPVAPAPPASSAAPSGLDGVSPPVPVMSPAPSIPPTPPAEPAPAVPAAADDFTRMKGVGPKLAAQLASLGYARFEQIAALTPEQADALDAQLGSFRGRLQRDRWIEQAGFLAKGDTKGFESAFGRL